MPGLYGKMAVRSNTVSSYVAKQQANRFLTMNVGNLLYAGEPELLIGQELQWRVPVFYALPKVGKLGKVGEVLVNVDTGDVTFAEMTTQEDIERNVEALHSTTEDKHEAKRG